MSDTRKRKLPKIKIEKVTYRQSRRRLTTATIAILRPTLEMKGFYGGVDKNH